jgi:hypothetical protein
MKAEEAELAEVRRRVLNSAMYDDDAPPPNIPQPKFGAPRKGGSNRRQQGLNITGRL